MTCRDCLYGLLFGSVSLPFLVATSAADETATISGQVAYTADAARPWRYQRYYVKDKKAGGLAEAVVVLSGKPLKDWPAAEPRTATMDQQNFQFVPETLAIRAGDSVRFTNSDMTTHNVKSVAPIATFNVNMEAEGDFTQPFERAGGTRTPVQLGCIYHGGMRAWVYVFDHPFYAITGADGTFRFENVPPGEYTLEMVHPAGQLRSKRTFTVIAGDDMSIPIDVSPDQKTLK